MNKLNDPASRLANTFIEEERLISEERREMLIQLAEKINSSIVANGRADIIVICTHNSRRSHIGDLVLKLGRIHFGLDQLHSFSGGTEITQLNPRLKMALHSLGIESIQSGSEDNPLYQLGIYEEGFTSDQFFSKVYSDPLNPQEHFIALMVCDHADQNCPFVPGATTRMSLPFKDPKAHDDTPAEGEAYVNTIHEIGRELFYALRQAVDHSTSQD